jgi:endo-1,4-beta-mannosidase
MQCFASPATNLEDKIRRTDWSTIRGANFIPSYASNSYEIWHGYNHDIFENDLRLASAVGYNSVRLWLNYAAFDELGTKMVDRVEDALRLCAKYHLRAVIVLFDSCGIHPRADTKWMTAGVAFQEFQNSSRFTPEQKIFMASLFKNYVEGIGAHTLVPVASDTPFMALLWQNWQSTPGNDRLGPDWFPKLEKYVDAVVNRLKDNPNVLLWDVMNEPEFASEGFLSANILITPEMEQVRDSFLHHFHQYLKHQFPNEIFSVGWASLDNAEKHSDWSDVVTFHVYGDAHQLSSAIDRAHKFAENESKQILITETLANWDFGRPDFGAMATDEAQLAHYQQVLPVLANSPVGWIGWGLVMSHDFDPYTDIFYPNGIPRPAAVFLERTLQSSRGIH